MHSLSTIFCLLVLLVSCNDDSADRPSEPTSAKPLTYLALGDSYTIGESVTAAERYPVQLTERLNADGLDVEAPKIIATTGWTTRNLIDGIAAEDIEGNTYDLVSLLIGVNNQFQGKPLPEYRTEFTELLNAAIAFAGGDRARVFVVSIPDYGYTPFGQNNQASISAGVDAFNDAARSITLAKEVDFFNITDISREWAAGDNTLVASDGLHPSGEQYRRWVESFYAAVREKF